MAALLACAKVKVLERSRTKSSKAWRFGRIEVPPILSAALSHSEMETTKDVKEVGQAGNHVGKNFELTDFRSAR